MRATAKAAVVAAFCAAALPHPAGAQALTGELRSKFIDGGVPTCLDGAKKSFSGNEKFMESAGVTDDSISAYCRCQMETLADQITPDEYGELMKGQTPRTIKGYAEAANGKCAPMLTTKKPS